MKKIENSDTFFIYKFCLYLSLFNLIISFCNKSKPFLQGDICVSNCDNLNSNNECILDNPVIKEQSLTNIIKIGQLKYRFINFASNLNGDMIVLINSLSTIKKRYFFGIKKNGRFFFENELSYFYSKDSSSYRYEGESLFIQLSNNNDTNEKDYFFTYGISLIVEFYNFDGYNNTLIKIQINNIFGDFISFRNSFFKLSSSEEQDKHYYLLTGMTTIYLSSYVLIKKCFFYINNNDLVVSCNTTRIYSKSDAKINSCLETDNHTIVCFIYSQDNKLVYYIFDQYFNKLNSDNTINLNYVSITNFFKGIQLKGEIIILSYYDKDVSDDNWNIYINLLELVKENNNINIKHLFNIKLEKLLLESNLMTNDMIKMDNNTIYISTVNSEKKILYIILLKIIDIELSKILVRYYSINIYELYTPF